MLLVYIYIYRYSISSVVAICWASEQGQLKMTVGYMLTFSNDSSYSGLRVDGTGTPRCLLYRASYKPPFGDCAIYSQHQWPQVYLSVSTWIHGTVFVFWPGGTYSTGAHAGPKLCEKMER